MQYLAQLSCYLAMPDHLTGINYGREPSPYTMMNLHRKTHSLGVVALLLWAIALAGALSWLLNREIAPQLQPSAVARWPQLLGLIYLTIFTITAGVGLPVLLLVHRWLFRPWQQLAAQINRLGANEQLGPGVAVSNSVEAGQLTHKINDLVARLEIARRRAQQYHQLIQQEPAGVVLIDAITHRVISANDAFLALTGYSHQHILRCLVYDLCTLPRHEIDAWCVALLDHSAIQTRDIGLVTQEGTSIEAAVSAIYLHGGEHALYGLIVHNLSERKQAERLLPLAQQSEGLRLLAGGIAHDFNNILTSILSQITLGLWQLPQESKAAEHLIKAARATERAAELTRQLLAYTGQGAFLVEELHLTHFIQDNTKLLATLVPSHAQLEWRLQPQSHLIKIDRGHAQQVLINLVINGAEALPLTGGVVRVETGEFTLYAEEARTFVRGQTPNPGHYSYLRVSDNGVGMGTAMLDRIFDPYYSTKENGSGLGLAAALGIVRHYGGGLQVESREGQGSSFTVLLPAATKREAKAEEPAIAAANGDGSSAQGQHPAWHDGGPSGNPHCSATVMIVDDEMPIREALYDLLSSEGMHVLLAADGHEGVALYHIHQAEIDLILLDMKMPGMNGAQTLVALRAINPAVKVVFCSGYSEAEALKSIGDQPVVAFLQKPIDINLLIKTIRNALG